MYPAALNVKADVLKIYLFSFNVHKLVSKTVLKTSFSTSSQYYTFIPGKKLCHSKFWLNLILRSVS